jgi:hypothetical protein
VKTRLDVDPDEILRTLKALFPDDDQALEVRLLDTPKGTQSGYFTDRDRLAREVAARASKAVSTNVSLNPFDPDLVLRSKNRIKDFSKHTTGDSDITRLTLLLIDCDPCRASGISATDEEHDSAMDRAYDVRDFLKKEMGWPNPIRADSGNGAHLLYRIDEPNDRETVKLLESVLKSLSRKFDDEHVKLDTKTANPARVCKLYGTPARKGSSAANRPHRLSKLCYVPKQQRKVKRSQLESLIAILSSEVSNKTHHKKAFSGSKRDQQMLDVSQWIAEVGLEVDGPKDWNEGSQLYSLKECAWNPAHNRGEAYIIQFADGGVDAGCPHNSCSGKGWPELRDAVEPGWKFRGNRPCLKKPTLVASGEFAEMMDQASSILIEGNNPPTLLKFGTALATVRSNEKQKVKLHTSASFRELIADRMRIVTIEGKGEKIREKPVHPQNDLVLSLLESPRLDGLPRLRGISFVPTVASDGTIRTEEGYDLKTQSYLVTSDFEGIVQSHVEIEEVESAIRWLIDWPLHDFPFADEASRTHFICMWLLPFVRSLVSGPTPLHLIQSPKRSTGKSLLARIGMNVISQHVADGSWKAKEDELEKTLDSILIGGYTHALLDNASGVIASPYFDKVLTSQEHATRILGHTRLIPLPNNAVWSLTANNGQLGGDLITRCLPIFLDSGEEYPEKRKDFKISNIEEWTQKKRVKIISKLLTIVRFWVQEGMPAYSGRRTHRMSSWMSVMGGVCQTAGLKGFLKNIDLLESKTDDEHDSASKFTLLWHEKFGSQPVSANRLVSIAYGDSEDDSPAPLWTEDMRFAENERSKVLRLSKWLSNHADQVYGGLKITVLPDRRNGNRYALRSIHD